jgi:hypothetical protein
MRRLSIPLVLVVVALAAFAWTRRASDEDQIRGQLTRLGAALHVSEGSNPLFRAPRVRSEFEAIFDDPTHASVPELPLALPGGRAALADKATELTSYYQTLDVSFTDVEIKLDSVKLIAHVAATAKLSTSGENATRDTRPVDFLFYKKDGTWRVTSVTVWEPRS